MALNGFGKPMLGLAAVVLLLAYFVDFNPPIGIVSLRYSSRHMFMVGVVVCFVICLLVFYRRPHTSSENDDKHRGPIDFTPIIGPSKYLGEISLEELRAYDGSDQTKPILLAVNSQIFDVTSAWRAYGPGGRYSSFAGKDATLDLLKRSWTNPKFDPPHLDPHIRSSVESFERLFKDDFVKVGTIKRTSHA